MRPLLILPALCLLTACETSTMTSAPLTEPERQLCPADLKTPGEDLPLLPEGAHMGDVMLLLREYGLAYNELRLRHSKLAECESLK